jgi:signal peptidase II
VRKGLLLLGALLLGLDIALKWWVQGHIPLVSSVWSGYPYGGIGIFKNLLGIQFSIVHHINTGAVWGIFSNHPYLLLAFRLALIAAMGVYLFRFNKHQLSGIPLMMIMAGALGNVIDIFAYGHVVDMFYFRLWGWSYPVFNLADAFIFLGVAWLLLQGFVLKRATA